MTENENKIVEEEGVSFYEVMKVLFGRKKLLAIVTASVFVAGSVAALVYNAVKQEFRANFTFSEKVMNGEEPHNLNQTDLDLRKYFNKESLLSYQENDELLINLNVERIIDRDGFSAPKWTIVEEYNKDTQETKIIKEDYEISIPITYASKEEAKAIVVDATNKVVQDNLDYLRNTKRDKYLDLFDSAILFEDKVNDLELEFDFILERYDALIERFGNVKALPDSDQLISEYRINIAIQIQNISFDDILKEIDNKSLVYDQEETLTILEAQLDSLNLDLKYNLDERADLISQREDIMASGNSMYTLDLTAYNEKIVSLTEQIYINQKQIELVEKKIDVINSTNPAVIAENQQNVLALTNRLNKIANDLKVYVNELKNIEIYQYETNMTTYFESSAVIKTVDAISVPTYCLVSLIIGFVAAIITNLCLDGKKLSKEYKKEHENK